MIEAEKIENLIKSSIPAAEVHVSDLTGTHDHYSVIVVSPEFDGLLPLKRHRMVNAAVREQIDSGAIHALQMNTYTPEEWEEHQE